MEILAVVLVIALVAAAGVIVMQRRRGGATRVRRPRTSPGGLRGDRSSRPLARAVEEKMAASGSTEVAVAEQRLQARARQVAAGLNAESHRVGHQRAADQVGHGAYDPAAAEPAPDSRFAPAPDPPYDDPAADPHYNDRR